jgi:hypothetical protein
MMRQQRQDVRLASVLRAVYILPSAEGGVCRTQSLVSALCMTHLLSTHRLVLCYPSTTPSSPHSLFARPYSLLSIFIPSLLPLLRTYSFSQTQTRHQATWESSHPLPATSKDGVIPEKFFETTSRRLVSPFKVKEVSPAANTSQESPVSGSSPHYPLLHQDLGHPHSTLTFPLTSSNLQPTSSPSNHLHLLFPIHTSTSTSRRLARRGGVYRIKVDIYDTIRAVLKARLEDILRRIAHVLMLAGASKGILKANGEVDETRNGRKLVTTTDVVFVLRQVSYQSCWCLDVLCQGLWANVCYRWERPYTVLTGTRWGLRSARSVVLLVPAFLESARLAVY